MSNEWQSVMDSTLAQQLREPSDLCVSVDESTKLEGVEYKDWVQGTGSSLIPELVGFQVKFSLLGGRTTNIGDFFRRHMTHEPFVNRQGKAL